jgi:hypothetical protein
LKKKTPLPLPNEFSGFSFFLLKGKKKKKNIKAKNKHFAICIVDSSTILVGKTTNSTRDLMVKVDSLTEIEFYFR